MKLIILIISCMLVISINVGCKKEHTHSPIYTDVTLETLSGRWELRYSAGGYRMPPTADDTKPGNGHIWSFTSTTYRTFQANQILDSGKYLLEGQELNPETGRKATRLVISHDSTRYLAEISNDTLYFYMGVLAADGTISGYVHIPF